MMGYTPHQAKFFAHDVTREGLAEGQGLAQTLSAAKVDLNPHQVDAAMFALRSPLSKGVLLADEVGLGKTIEAALVITQRWWEGRRHLLLIAPASLRKQWQQELSEKFSLPSVILDAKRVKELKKVGEVRPLERREGVIILSYEYAARIARDLQAIKWDLVVMDEAHKLRNVYRANEGSRSVALRMALADRQKLLLTATPLQNNLMELYGLLSIIDDHFFGSPDAFRAEFGKSDAASLAVLGRRLEPICKRTLRRQVQQAGLINYTNRLPSTFDFTPSHLEAQLYEHMSAYLQRDDTVAVGKVGRHLVTLVLRKILGSSSFAIAGTLDKMIGRLEAKQEIGEETLDDYDGVEETAATWRDDGADADADRLDDDEAETLDAIDPEMLRAEIAELKSFRDLAHSLSSNAKGQALLASLPGALDEIARKNGQRKAVIFTESVRTQTYLRELLEQNGFAGQTVLMNESNADRQSQAIYKGWLQKHAGDASVVSKTKSADMKAAIVESFRNDRSILIATESGAEGINLQFCSSYRFTVTRAFSVLGPQTFDASAGKHLPLTTAPTPLSAIKQFVFTGAGRGCFALSKFDSDAERRLAVLLDREDGVEKWMKPGPGQFRIEDENGEPYHPDFVVETKTDKLILEPKRRSDMTDADVVRKARSAALWCYVATEHHAKPTGGKRWRYALIPDDAIQPSATLAGLMASHTVEPDIDLLGRYALTQAA